ncbi:WD repeat-containing protein on Y chromosome-like [Centruroides sculpturatus]|uniref:WD repeat-containing protein on Y chromosome-like n=1 Tax=Centruroides sculpturatus TaxID=218467 RepID=UPI000C6E4797|nr:WD repeat-containing protein on Y chromosome-like [Centruroides sculpturatus]
MESIRERIECLIRKSHLEKMKELLSSTSDDVVEDKKIDFDTFKVLIESVISKPITEDEIRSLFDKVDIYCKQEITWRQFIAYIMKDSFNKDMIQSFGLHRPFKEDTKTIKTTEGDELEFVGDYRTMKLPRNDSIKQIIYYENHIQGKSCLSENGQYIVVSEKGILDFLSAELRRINRLDALGQIYYSVCVNAMIFMMNAKMLVISTNLRDIRFYVCHPFFFTKKYEIIGFYYDIICMDYAIDPEDFKHGYLSIGNDHGDVGYFNFTECEIGSPFGVNTLYGLSSVIHVKEIINGKITSIKLNWFEFSYDDWVGQVKYVERINSIISCAASSNVSLCIHPITKNVHHRFKVRRGILCFDYCYIQNLIITGGMDYSVRIWNPYVTNKASAILLGHASPVVKVFMDSKRHLAFSISMCKYIFVWDIERQEAVLKIDGNFMTLDKTPLNLNTGRFRLTSAFYNPNSTTIIIGSNNLEIFKPRHTQYHKEIKSHPSRILDVLFSDKYEYIISGCDKYIKIWNLKNGAKILQFEPVTKKMIKDGDVITAITLDGSKKRLITGTSFGCIKTWNFCNGELLVELSIKDRKEITKIVVSDNKIFVVGKDKRVTVFHDSEYESKRRIWQIVHKEDISGLVVNKRNIVATSSYDGEIVLWSIEIGYTKHILHDDRKLDDVERLTEQELRMIKRNRPTFSEVPKTLNIPKKPYASIDNILFLQTRLPASGIVNLLATGKDGYIRGWAIDAECTLLVRFFGAVLRKDAITCMKTNSENTYLLTGDTSGYISVWYLANFYNGLNTGNLEKELTSFTYTRILPGFLICKKKVLFRGHTVTVNCIEFVENYKYIITGSTDCCVRLWTLNGRFLGTFGDKHPWNLDRSYLATSRYVIPEEIKRCGTPMTLRVLNGGMSRLWKATLNVISFLWMLLGKQKRAVAAGKIIKEIEVDKKKIYEDDFFDFKLPKHILGKYYQPKQEYIPLPKINLISNEKEVFPFMSLPTYELETINPPQRNFDKPAIFTTLPGLKKWKKSAFETSKEKHKLKKKS